MWRGWWRADPILFSGPEDVSGENTENPHMGFFFFFFFFNIYLAALSLSGGLWDLSLWRMSSVAPWHVGILDP